MRSEREGAMAGSCVWPTCVERTFSAWRAYYRFVPRGKFSIDYTLRLNNAGEFSSRATRIDAVYAPEMFGELSNGRLSLVNRNPL